MLIYFLNIISILLYVTIIYSFNNNHLKSLKRIKLYEHVYSKIATIFITLQLLMLSIIKNYDVGHDTSVYMEEFYRISKMSFIDILNHRWELGYVFLNKIVSIISVEFRLFIILLNVILYTMLYKFLMKESRLPWLSLFLFVAFDFFAFSLSGYRQITAMFITMLSIKYIKQNHFWKFAAVVLLASLFHQSALAFIIVYPVSKMKLNKLFYSIMLASGVFLYAFGGYLVRLVASIYHRQQNIQSGSGQNYFILISTIVIVGLFIYYKYRSTMDGKYIENIDVYIKIMIISLVLQIFSFHLSVFVRVVHYFTAHLIIFIPNIYMFIPDGNRKKIVLLGVFIISIVLFIYFLSVDSSGIAPYQHFWQ